MAKKPRYSAVVLSEESYQGAIKIARKHAVWGVDWDLVAHHMTIKMGELPPELKEREGEIRTLHVVGLGISETVVALQVSDKIGAGTLSKNEVPHVTIAVDRNAGAKPFHSNLIKEWKPIETNILVGRIEEVY